MKVKERRPETAIVLITAYNTPDLERHARNAGVDHFLPKPIQLDQLEQLVEHVLSRARQS
jgi:YesN/AraC family two-component response regulator